MAWLLIYRLKAVGNQIDCSLKVRVLPVIATLCIDGYDDSYLINAV